MIKLPIVDYVLLSVEDYYFFKNNEDDLYDLKEQFVSYQNDATDEINKLSKKATTYENIVFPLFIATIIICGTLILLMLQ